MDISSLSTASLRSVIGLVEKREKLLADLAKIESQINAVLPGDGVAPWKVAGKRGRKAKAKLEATGSVAAVSKSKKSRKSSGRRGGLKDKVLAELEAAGKTGVSVKDLAAKLGVKPQNIHVWFATTGKKLTRKIGPGRYAF